VSTHRKGREQWPSNSSTRTTSTSARRSARSGRGSSTAMSSLRPSARITRINFITLRNRHRPRGNPAKRSRLLPAPLDLPARSERKQHRYVAPIVLIRPSEIMNQVTLFEVDGDQDVRGVCNCEDQVCERHRRRHPEGEQPAEVQRVTDDAVGPGRGESQWRGRLPAPVKPDLP